MAKLTRNPQLDERPYMQPDERNNPIPTGPDGGDLTTYTRKPRQGRNVYVGSDASVAGGGRSAGRGGLTAEEMRDVEEAGITTARKIKRGDYGKPGMAPMEPMPKAKGGKVQAYAKGGSVRGGGCEARGKTKGRMV